MDGTQFSMAVTDPHTATRQLLAEVMPPTCLTPIVPTV